MKLLVDENLPPRLTQSSRSCFRIQRTLGQLELSGAPDAAIFGWAKAHGLAFLTKDKDFANLSIILGAPPKVVLLQTGNCSTTDLIQIVRYNEIRLSEFEFDPARSLLVLR